jgi:hypothetical protein
MELERLANIWEFLGGLAILVSLLYLLINLRQNTNQLRENAKALKRAEMRSSWEQHDRFRVATLDRDLAQLFVDGLSGEKRLDAADRQRFGNLMTMMTYSVENNWEISRQGLDEDGDVYERIAPYVADAYSSSGGRRWWERSKRFFKPGFVKSMDSYLQAKSQS